MLFWIVIIAIIVIVILLFQSGVEHYEPVSCDKQCEGVKLWMDHMNFTREFILSYYYNLPTVDDTTQRLLKNQDDLAKYISSIYGRSETYSVMEGLLRQHILIAADIIKLMKNGGNVSESLSRWDANAREIAEYLSTLNPKYNYGELENYLLTHLRTTQEEAEAIFKGQSGIPQFDKAVDHMIEFNYYLT